MKAIVLCEPKSAQIVTDRPLPKLRDDYILVKVVAIALNPTDWKHISRGIPLPGHLSGCDYAGIVEEVGPAVTKPFKKGDRICGCCNGGNYSQPEDGAFAEYIMVKGDVAMHIPDSMSFEDASTVSLGAITCGQGLFQAMKLDLPPSSGDNGYVLIYGGSSATGSLAIQYCKLAGYTVITTCSPRNNDFVKSLGADAVFDYSDSECGAKIRAHTSNSLKLVWDTIGTDSSSQICADAFSSDGTGCRYGEINRNKLPRDDIPQTGTIMYTMFGEYFEKFGNKVPANKEHFEFAKIFMGLTEKFLMEGKLKTHPAKVGPDGLKGAMQGMEDMKAGKVSGVKLVYKVAVTP